MTTNKELRKPMPRKVTVRNHKRVSVCLSEDQLDKVEKMAIRLSQEEGKIVTISEAIRRAVEVCYPIMKQGIFLND